MQFLTREVWLHLSATIEAELQEEAWENSDLEDDEHYYFQSATVIFLFLLYCRISKFELVDLIWFHNRLCFRVIFGLWFGVVWRELCSRERRELNWNQNSLNHTSKKISHPTPAFSGNKQT